MKIATVFMLFLLVLSLSILYIILIVKTNKVQIRHNIFIKKALKNEPYFPSDFINDIPFIIDWTIKKCTNKKHILRFTTLLIICTIVKFIQKIIAFIMFPFICFEFIYKINKKNELTCRNKTKFNSSFKDILSIIFIKVPKAAIFKLLYRMLKLYHIKNNKKKKNLFHIIYNIFIINLLGYPLWFLESVNRLDFKIQNSIANSKNKKKWIIVFFNLTLNDINALLNENEYSHLNIANTLRIFFEDGYIKFNPMWKLINNYKKGGLIEMNEIKSVISTTPRNKEKIHPLIIIEETKNEENKESDNSFTTGAIKTHKKLNSQRSFNSNNNSSTVYNDLQHDEIVTNSNKTTYKPSEIEIKNEVIRTKLHRMSDSEAGINVQSKKSSSEYKNNTGFYYDNVVEYFSKTSDKESKLIHSLVEECTSFNKELSSSSKLENIQQSLENLNIKNYSNNVSVSNDTPEKCIKSIEKINISVELNQEYGVTDEIIKEIQEAIDEGENNEASKFSSPSKGMNGFNGEM